MKRLDIDYDAKRDCFADIRNIQSDLIFGNPECHPAPWFSYIVPVYKRADLLRETLASILDQKQVDFEWDIVVVDNEAGGENETERLIRELDEDRILYYRNRENVGPDGNYNRCIELARGKWLAMLHGDDLIVDDHLEHMSKYIKEKEKGKKPLAYIGVGYQDFKDVNKAILKRGEIKEYVSVYRNKLKRYTQTDAVITGYSVSLPSFGTIMNKGVLLKTGGFDERLGICEDVITPYRLMKDYRVYVTPEIMGYHRFEGNESIKSKNIFRICEAMCDFREYMFSRNIITKVWGNIARTPFFDLITEYCSYLSGFTEERIKKSDFAYIYPERKDLKSGEKIVFNLVERLYCLITGAITYEKGIDISVTKIADEIKRGITKETPLIIYGAGRAGRNAERILRKKYGIKTDLFAVSNNAEESESKAGIPVKNIKSVKEYANSLVLIATSVPEFYDEMENTLIENDFKNYIALDERFRT